MQLRTNFYQIYFLQIYYQKKYLYLHTQLNLLFKRISLGLERIVTTHYATFKLHKSSISENVGIVKYSLEVLFCCPKLQTFNFLDMSHFVIEIKNLSPENKLILSKEVSFFKLYSLFIDCTSRKSEQSFPSVSISTKFLFFGKSLIMFLNLFIKFYWHR